MAMHNSNIRWNINGDGICPNGMMHCVFGPFASGDDGVLVYGECSGER